MSLMSMRGYAKHRGVSPEAVSKAVKQGRISTVLDEKGDRKIDPTKADIEWEKNTVRGQKDAPQPEPEADKPDGQATVQGPSYAQSRAIREAYQARLARLAYEEKAGKLVSADKVRITAFNTSRIVRDSILNIPDRIAHELAAETDPHRLHVMLTEALIEALEELTIGKSGGTDTA
jgi:hypothetical protein